MCFSNCPYENYEGECSFQNPGNYPHDAHCSEESEVQMLEDRYESEWHEHELSADQQAFMSGISNPRNPRRLT